MPVILTTDEEHDVWMRAMGRGEGVATAVAAFFYGKPATHFFPRPTIQDKDIENLLLSSEREQFPRDDGPRPRADKALKIVMRGPDNEDKAVG
jgi:hypothetical protein